MKNSDLFKGVYFCQIYEKGRNTNKYYYLFMIWKNDIFELFAFGFQTKKLMNTKL